LANNITVKKEQNNTISVIQSDANRVTVSSAVTQVSGVGTGGTGDKTFVHNFTNLTWQSQGDEFFVQISHNLDKYPSVSVIDSVDNVVYLSVEYTNKNTVKLYSMSIFSGSAYFN